MLPRNVIPFIVDAIVSWTLLFIFIDYKQLKRNVWLGVIAYVMGVVVDYAAYKAGLYTMHLFNLEGLTPLLIGKIVMVFPIGTLYAQYMPKTRIKQLFSIILLDIGYTSIDLFLTAFGTLTSAHWSIYNSIIYNIFIFTRQTDPVCNLDYVPNGAREANLNIGLSNSFGFGGHNAVIVLKNYNP